MDGVIYYVLALLVAIVAVWQVHYRFSIAIISWVVFVLSIVLLSLKKSKDLSDQTSERWTHVVGRILDIISNIATIRFFARREYEMDYLNVGLGSAVMAEQEKNTFFLKLYAIQAGSFVLLQCVCLWMLIFGIKTGSATAGDFSLVLTINSTVAEILYSLSRSLRILSDNLGKVTQGLRIIELLPNGTKSEGLVELTVSRGEIVFENVCFRYKGSSPLFSNKTLTINAGHKIGLVGHSGSGKSTFVNLILRMFKPQSGHIFIDGQDINKMSAESIGNSIAVIPQEPQLFHRTLMENIRYGRLDATDEEVVATAKLIQAHDFIVNLSDGYGSLVGDRGVKLSGGQRQRIAIARAILKKAPILILDEATSGLDLLVESEVQGNLWKLMQGKTVIVIAHRLTTLLQMDKIFVFKQGRVVEEGSHVELLQRDGAYKALWKMQTGELA
jgi:ATP-binding cassette subfamily B protein